MARHSHGNITGTALLSNTGFQLCSRIPRMALCPRIVQNTITSVSYSNSRPNHKPCGMIFKKTLQTSPRLCGMVKSANGSPGNASFPKAPPTSATPWMHGWLGTGFMQPETCWGFEESNLWPSLAQVLLALDLFPHLPYPWSKLCGDRGGSQCGSADYLTFLSGWVNGYSSLLCKAHGLSNLVFVLRFK